MADQIKPIREWKDVTRELFENEIRPLRQPAVIRGLVADWPLVTKGRESAATAVQYLKQLYTGKRIGTIRAAPSEKGRLFYDGTMQGFNFQRTMQDLRFVLQELLEIQGVSNPPTLAMQAITAPDHLPNFPADHVMPLIPDVEPRLWIGNAAVIAPHYDLLENIGCVAIGRRRFTLFPPEQLDNLYVGPLDNTPAGAPVSVVDVNNPDLEKYPRFAEALASAQQAELGPGDAVFIPYMWWHGVQALEPFNILVNYWWDEHRFAEAIPPNIAMMVARLAFGKMSPEQLGRWRTMFDHYVFNSGEHPMAHLPEHARGMFGDLDPKQARTVRRQLAGILSSS